MDYLQDEREPVDMRPHNDTVVPNVLAVNDPEYKKKLRIEKMKKSMVTKQVGIGTSEVARSAVAVSKATEIMEDPTKSDWAKMQVLKQLEAVRDTNKGAVINRLLSCKVKCVRRIFVTPG